MTQEEKFEEAKRLYETANADQRYVLESLFPELAESEDERIRGAIIDHLKDNNLTEWAAWLERQGEQKSIWHDASEEPNGKEYVIAWDGKYASIARYKSIVNCKWCYLSDILPNKEKGV